MAEPQFDPFVNSYFGRRDAALSQPAGGAVEEPVYKAGMDAVKRFLGGQSSSPSPGRPGSPGYEAGQAAVRQVRAGGQTPATTVRRSSIRYQLPGGEWKEFDSEAVSASPGGAVAPPARKAPAGYPPGVMAAEKVAARAAGESPLKPGSEATYRTRKSSPAFADRIPTEFAGKRPGGFVQGLPSDEERMLAGYLDMKRRTAMRDLTDPNWKARGLEADKARLRNQVNEEDYQRRMGPVNELLQEQQAAEAERATKLGDLDTLVKAGKLTEEQAMAARKEIDDAFQQGQDQRNRYRDLISGRQSLTRIDPNAMMAGMFSQD